MKVEMSSKAVTVRLRRVSQLRRLCLSLGRAGGTRVKESEQGCDEVRKKVGDRDFDVSPTYRHPGTSQVPE